MEQTVLGFDFGCKRIGVAVGQNLTYTATALTQIAVIAGEADWQQIETLIKKWCPDLLVVGLPLNLDGSRGPMVVLVEKFIKQLEQRYRLAVKPVNEILSTRAAKARLTELHGNTRWSKQDLNSMAAQIIVETYLNSVQKVS